MERPRRPAVRARFCLGCMPAMSHYLLGRARAAGPNPVIAMPSIHAGFASLIAITLMARICPRWRYPTATYPAVMAFALVYTGEH